MKKLAILTLCGKNKYDLQNVKALDLYKGNNFPILRKNNNNNVDIFIISAKYGLINENEKIDYYEKVLDDNRFEEIKHEVLIKFQDILNNDYNEIIVCAGGNYKKLFEKCNDSRLIFIYNPFQKARLVLKLFMQKYNTNLNWNNIISDYENDNIIMKFFNKMKGGIKYDK